MLKKSDFLNMLHDTKKVICEYVLNGIKFNIIFTKNNSLWYFSNNQYQLSNGTLYDALKKISNDENTTAFEVLFY